MQRLALAILLILAISGGSAFGLFHYAKRKFVEPGALSEPAVLLIPRGAGLDAISRQMEAAGIIDQRWIFVAAVRFLKRGRALKAGEFAFPAGVSMSEALEIVASGKTIAYKLTLPEGLTSAEIVQLIRQTDKLTGELTAVPPEGSLLPETYHFSRGDGRDALVVRMSEALTGLLAELWPNRQNDLPLRSPAEAVVLASIVEKETGKPEERPLVAGVFINRLNKGMRLQSDPTVAYGLTLGEKELGRPLTTWDLKTPSKFNTYMIDGLPPAPIANPGRGALEAVLRPAETKYLYFVADGTGGHAFAKSLAEHNRNVAKWRKIQRAERAKAAE